MMPPWMGEVDYAPGESRNPVAPAPRVRDRHLHARRHLPAPRLQRRQWADKRRRHPVDDRVYSSSESLTGDLEAYDDDAGVLQVYDAQARYLPLTWQAPDPRRR